jgi:hypothetical protein
MARPQPRPGERRSPAPRLLLAAFALLLVGALIGRASAPSAAKPPAPPQATPVRDLHGVPVGFPHTPRGAAIAVASYQRAFASPAILNPAVLRRRVAVVAAPDYAATMLAANSPGAQRIAAGAIGEGLRHRAPTLFAAVPIGYRIESYSPARARVLTWGFTLLGNASAVAPEAYFGLTTTEVAWQGGRWRIASTRAAFGPSPKLETRRGPVEGFDAIALAARLHAYGLAP